MASYVCTKMNNDFEIEYYNGIGFSEDICSLHSHPYHEFSLVTSGDITYASNNTVDNVDEKCFIFSCAHHLHNPYINQEKKYQRHQLRFQCDFLSKFIPEYESVFAPLINFSGIWRLSNKVYHQMHMIVELLLHRYQTDGNSQTAMLEYRLLTAELMLLAKDVVLKSNKKTTALTSTYIDDVINHIKNHYGEDLNLSTLCAKFFVSNTKLANDFKKHVGMTLGKYITLTRIESAKNLLATGYSVSSVAKLCGYPGTSYFIKLFHEYTSLTPLKFQQISQEK